ncbi:hypothetical protein N7G274_010874 [Stereocaulon virgatum]|uniref:C2H2-type domain-containing protein n=1 Tax=Stereocaulon virgatum TaxID=373712 RepID=A0ABR3ZSS0_9LECA
MEQVGLIYLQRYGVLACQDHGYCLTRKSFRRHLWSHHAVKGQLVRRVTDVVDTLNLIDPSLIPLPPASSPPIPELSVHLFYRCTLANCGGEPASRSQQREIVVKHQSKAHGVGVRKAIKPDESAIELVSMQSFFPHPLLRWFQVQTSQQVSPTSTRSLNCMQRSFQQALDASKEEWQAQFEAIPTPELHQSQTPPWLVMTGIAPFLERLQLEKTELRSLYSSPVASGKAVDQYVQQAVSYRLLQLRLYARPGSNTQMLDRIVARRLNSFDPDRMQSKPFIGVQNTGTMERYAAAWGQLILFLLRIQQSDSETLAEYLLYPDDTLQSQVDDVADTLRALVTVNADNTPLEDYLRRSEHHTSAQRLHAKALVHAISTLSMYLVRQTRQQDPFYLAVIAYSSLHTLNQHGAWKAASEFRPFLSAMIHCMQLWLLGHCIQHCEDTSTGLDLSDYATEQCRLHLINTSRGPIAELSYWRLMVRSSKNDNPRPPMTIVTDDCMQVNHECLELRLPAWRRFLQDILTEASELLEQSLLFDLSDLTTYTASSLRDDFTRTEPGWSFLQDTRNGLTQAKDYVLNHLRTDTRLQQRFFKGSLREERSVDELQYCRPAIAGYLHADKRFLQLLAVLIIMTAGLPPRRPELLGIYWCNRETPRNLYIYDGLLAVLTSYHKSQWRVGSRPIARFLPPSVGDLVIRYLIYVIPVVNLFTHCMRSPIPRGALFREGQGLWLPAQLSTAVKLHTRRLLGFPLKISQWRHIAIALDRRLLQGVACQVYNINPDAQVIGNEDDSDSDRDDWIIGNEDDSDSDRDDWTQSSRMQTRTLTASRVHSLQAAHTLETGVAHYGNSRYPFALMTDVLLADFTRVSRQWHQICQLPSPELVACSHKRAVSETAEQAPRTKRIPTSGRLHTRRQLWR